MFPLYELLSHAELTNPRRSTPQSVEARRSARHARCGRLTLFPCVARSERIEAIEEDEPRVVAAISNVSSTGVGLLHSDELPAGLQFDVDWESGDEIIPLRFEVVHSRPTSAGMFRTGARLMFGEMPAEPQPTTFCSPVESSDSAAPVLRFESASIEAEPTATAVEIPARTSIESIESSELTGETDAPPAVSSPGVLRFEPAEYSGPSAESTALPGTFNISAAFGFDKTERLDGVTTCGWERSLEIRRSGDRLWIYIHSPGKKNGWGLFVNPSEFEAALNRVQESASSPFITTRAA